ncbi:hypothetical protein [Streptomyces sp. Wb2n-11]|uniref:hypothetical protein n=1 Tax=Streptomyces sp. Wb2n-11 TaxID=1030533 RepID=UPI000AEF573A|nr:hypothetical protein [Streptomyces sp. Wb2n-11]
MESGVLGPPVVRIDGTSVVPSAAKPRQMPALLALLAVNAGHDVSMATLMTRSIMMSVMVMAMAMVVVSFRGASGVPFQPSSLSADGLQTVPPSLAGDEVLMGHGADRARGTASQEF